jgi:phosphatidate cytidylyltransferase
MKSRILTALVLFPPVIYIIGWSPWWLFLAAVAFTGGVSLREYFEICRQSGLRTLPALAYAGAAGTMLAAALALRGGRDLSVLVLGVFILLTASWAVWRIEDAKHYLAGAAATVLGVLYIALPLSFLIPLRFRDTSNGTKLILLLFLVIWAGDICAYFVGRTLGRHLLFPRVSPKKTYEGAVAGLAGSLLVAWVFTHWFWPEAHPPTVLLLAGLISVAGQIGDFAESAMKRGAGLKDSGTILPGHGGMLDRIDALLFGSAVLWLALLIKDDWTR